MISSEQLYKLAAENPQNESLQEAVAIGQRMDC
jgi:hypothetical protein